MACFFFGSVRILKPYDLYTASCPNLVIKSTIRFGQVMLLLSEGFGVQRTNEALLEFLEVNIVPL